jgi:catechol 2,3-dioxygenase-like lactoylglutathione lyase family enzyme
MAKRPVSALRVSDLNRSIAFWCGGLDYTLDWSDPEAGVAQISRAEGLPLLLARHDVADITSWTDPPHHVAPPGKTIYLMGAPMDLRAYHAALTAKGLQADPVITEPDDSLVLRLTDPDGYRPSFWQGPELTDAQIIERYAAAPAKLAEALDGLTEEQLDLVRAPGKWSIRQTVHHMTDSEATSLLRMLMALAEPGRAFNANPYSQDAWVAGLDAAHRPVGPSVALFTAIRAHVTALVRHLPGAMDRAVETPAGRVTVRQTLYALCSHAIGHTAQILETRQVHGL